MGKENMNVVPNKTATTVNRSGRNFLDSICPDLLSMSQRKPEFSYPAASKRKRKSDEWGESPSSKRSPQMMIKSTASSTSLISPTPAATTTTTPSASSPKQVEEADNIKDLLKTKADEIEQKRKAALEKRRRSVQQQQF